MAGVLAAPKDGKTTRKELTGKVHSTEKDIRMVLADVSQKLGLISKQKKAELSKRAVEVYNQRRGLEPASQDGQDPRPGDREDRHKTRERVHSREARKIGEEHTP